MKRYRPTLLLLPALAALSLALGLSLLAPRAGSAYGAAPLVAPLNAVLTSTAAPPDAPTPVVTAATPPTFTQTALTATAVLTGTLPGAESTVTATAAPPAISALLLKDSGISIVATAPVVTGSLNTTYLILNSPDVLPLSDARLMLDFWSRGALVLHLPLTLTLQPGPNVVPLVWSTASFSPTFDSQADNALVAQWIDAGGNPIDRAQRALDSFGADPLPALALSTESVWDVGTLTQGAALDLSFVVANTGSGDLAVYLAEPGITLPYRRLAPGDMTFYTLTLDTLALPLLPFSHTLILRTSDPAAPLRSIQLSGVVAPPAGPTSVFALPNRPWDRRLVVYGALPAQTPLSFSDIPSPASSANVPCTLTAAATRALQGVGRVCLDTTGSLFGSANGSRVLFEPLDAPLLQFSLPQAITNGAAYELHFGKLYSFAAGGAPLTGTLSVISQTYAAASLDALLTPSAYSLPVNVQLALGNLAIYSQTQLFTQPTLIHIPDFAGALNQVLSAQPLSDNVDVPFQLSLSAGAAVVLTNFVPVPARSIGLSIQPGGLAFGPPVMGYTLTEGLLAPITATVHNSGRSDSGPLLVAFYAAADRAAAAQPRHYLGAALVANVPAGGSAPATLAWDSTSFTGVVSVTAVVDPFGRLPESSSDHATATAALTLLARPAVAVTRIVPADTRPYPNSVVPVAVVLRNSGQTDALSVTVALYDSDASSTLDLLGRQVSGPLLAGTILLDSYRLPVAAGAELTATLIWTPRVAGPRHLVAVVSANSAPPFLAGSGLQAMLPVFVGFRGPILIDSGGLNDIAYSPTVGYGFLGADGGPGRVCGAASYQASRQGPDGTLQYRIDNFQPGRAYHLDLTFGECDGVGRRQRVLVNGTQWLSSVDLSDEQPHHYSLRLDPALYADSVITLTVAELHGAPALLSALHVYDIDYRDVLAGAPDEQPYPLGSTAAPPGSRAFGYLNGAPQALDNAPFPAMRTITTAQDLRYRFDQLDPARRYALNLTFYHRYALTPTLALALGRWYQSPVFAVPAGEPYAVTIAVPREAYAANGSLTLSISRTDVLTGAFVSELTLEEQTLGETFASADLLLLTLDSPRVITAGVPVTYTLLVVNNGPDVARDVVLNSPAGSTALRLAGSAGDYCADAGHLSCPLGEFASGASMPLSVVLRPTAAGPLAIAFSIDSAVADPNSANNSVLLNSQVVPAAP